MSSVAQLTLWQCHKKVRAEKIIGITTLPDQVDNEKYRYLLHYDGGSVAVDDAYMDKHSPTAGDYYVQYEDGYASCSPAHAFESGYTKIG